MTPHAIDPRRDFGLPDDVAWLDTAHQGALPRVAAAAASWALASKLDPSKLEDQQFFEAPDRLRAILAGLLGTAPEEIIIGNSASHGLHVLASGLDLTEGDEVLLVRDDFPATVTPWLPLEERGVRIRFLPRRAGLTPGAVAEALGPDTRVFCVTWVDSFSGDVLDVGAVGRVCHAAGVGFVLNATQGFGVRPLPVRHLPLDAVTCAGYKWLCGPYGTGFCWVHGELVDRLRSPRRYWLPSARDVGLDDLAGLLDGPLPRGAARHDVFCTASFFNVLPWIAALEYLTQVGLEAAAAHNVRLVEAACAVVRDRGHAVVSLQEGHPSPFLVFEPVGEDAASLVARLEASRVYVSLRNGRIRVTPHLQNDESHIALFNEALRR